jgi:hypothetical protein
MLNLNYAAGFTTSVGDQFDIIDVTGQFANVPSGTVTLGGVTYTVTYVGGPSGHDLVLTVTNAGPFQQNQTGTTVTQLSVTTTTSATAGGAISVTVIALDGSGNPVTNFTGVVHFSSNDHAALLPADSLLNNGAGVYSVTLVTPGTQTVTVTANGVFFGISSAITVSPGSSGSSSSSGSSGSSSSSSSGSSGNSSGSSGSTSSGTVNYVVAAAGPGGGPLVNVYDASTGSLVTSFDAFAPTFTGGVRVAVADVNGDGTPDIICVAGPGGGPEVAVFDGKTFQRIMDFEALPAQFTGGLFVAAGTITSQAYADIVVSADSGGGPEVTIFDGQSGAEVTAFYATAATFTGGIRIACGDLSGNGFDDVIAAAGPGGGPQVTIFDGKSLSLLTAFYALPSTFTGGMYVAAGDVNGDGHADIIVGAEKGGGPEVNVFSGAGISAGSGMPPSLYAFYALPPQFTGGVRVGYSSDFEGAASILTVAGPGGGPQVSIFDGITMANLDSFYAFAPTFGGGVYVGGN